jgi:IS5 family transposase
MLRVFVSECLYSLSGEEMEYLLRDRLSFLRFARLGLGDAEPEIRTFRLYSDRLAQADAALDQYATFNQQLAERGILVKKGMMVDAIFVEVPRQRKSPKDYAKIEQVWRSSIGRRLVLGAGPWAGGGA